MDAYEFERKIKAYIEEDGRSQAAVARKLGYKPDAFNKMVKGVNRMPYAIVNEFCDVLRLNANKRIELLHLAGYTVPSSLLSQPIEKSIDGPLLLRDEMAPSHVPTVPLQRQQPIPHFVGREEEIQRVLEHLHPGHIVTLVGPAGIGKTQIASKVVERLSPDTDLPERFPDGIIFYSFYGDHKDRADIVLKHVLTALGDEPGPSLDESTLHALARKQLLLWLDGAECADNINRVLDVCGRRCAVLITSQKRQDIKEHGIEISPLPFVDADTVMRTLGRNGVHHEMARKRIYDLVSDVTLAIELAGAHLRDLQTKEAVEDYLEWLERRCLEALHTGDHRRESVYILMAKSVSLVHMKLGEGVRLVLGLMGTLAFQPVDHRLLAQALGVHEDEVKTLVEGLTNYSVVLREGNLYMLRHNMLYEYVKRHLKTPDEAVARLAYFYASLAEEQSKKETGAFARLDRERAHMVAVVSSCVARQRWSEAYRLTLAVDTYLDRHGFITEREITLQAGLAAANALQDHRAVGDLLNRLGSVFAHWGMWNKALETYQRAFHVFVQQEDDFGIAQLTNNLGLLYTEMGKWDLALQAHQYAYDVLDQMEDLYGKALSGNNIGNIYVKLGEWKPALAQYREALEINRQIDNIRGQAHAYDNIGTVFGLMGEWEGAILCHQESIQLKREIEDIHGEAQSHGNLAHVYNNRKEFQQAITHYEHAQSIFTRLNDIRGQAQTYDSMGLILGRQRDWEKALDFHRKALELRLQLKHIEGEAHSYSNLGTTHLRKGEVKQALEYYGKSLEIREQLGDKYGKALLLNNIGAIYLSTTRIEEAKEAFAHAYQAFVQMGSPNAEKAAAGLAQACGSVEAAKAYLAQVQDPEEGKPT